MSVPDSARVTLRELQDRVDAMYGEKDRKRGAEATFLWLMEEVGELAAALRSSTHEELESEFADVLAWLITIANVKQVDLTRAMWRKYGLGCPGCGTSPCVCADSEKP